MGNELRFLFQVYSWSSFVGLYIFARLSVTPLELSVDHEFADILDFPKAEAIWLE